MEKHFIKLAVLMSIFNMPAFAASLPSFVQVNKKQFIELVASDPADQRGFENYYDQLLNLIDKSPIQKKQATYRDLYSKAVSKLKQDKVHPGWYQEISPYLTSNLPEETKVLVASFLTRYGAFEEYKSFKETVLNKALAQHASTKVQVAGGWWNSIKSYAHAVTDTIAGLFGFATA